MTMLNIKIDAQLKKAAQEQAARLGLPLSVILNNYMRTFVAERRVVFEEPLLPNKKTAAILRKAVKDLEEGNTKEFSPVFTSPEEMDAWLEKEL